MKDTAIKKEINRKNKVYLLLKDLTQSLDKSNISGFDTIYISKVLNIDRTGCSRILNELVRENKAVKILGKPVLFLEKRCLEEMFLIDFDENVFRELNTLLNVLNKIDNSQYDIKSSIKNKMESDSSKNKASSLKGRIFDNIIGADDSLKNQINQAKAAILYPPNGLHTLILGPTGVGKTTFAEIMYRYAIEVGKFKSNAPYIIFNCADYTENSQLLLSHLFGHIKGAFTGADKEKKGIVDAANGGILFLDEIHRLPSQGQEMLFSLMDRGSFRRLGESHSIHKADILIIAATTEDINRSILKTFLRRIPCRITLPGLIDRSLKDRLKLILAFFKSEAKKIKIPLTVSEEVLKLLLIYDCPGNIGQLKNDIRLISAGAFAETIINNKEHVNIDLHRLPDRFKNAIFNLKDNRSKIYEVLGTDSFGEVTFNFSNESNENLELENILMVDNYKIENNFYNNILIKSMEYFKNGESIENIRKNINYDIERYLNKDIYKKDKKEINNYEVISRIVSQEILDCIKDIFYELKFELKFEVDKKLMYSLALHVETLIGRINSGIKNSKYNVDIDKNSQEYLVAYRIKDKLEKKLNINIPKEEAIFIAMFLTAIRDTKRKKYIGIIVLAHGDNTATSMANVANRLLDTNHAKAIDMPLEESVNKTLEKVIELVKDIDNGRGVLLLVDMGSLATFSEIITEKTGVLTGIIKMVSTPMVIEATRKSMMDNIDLYSLIKEVNSMSKYIGKSVTIMNDKTTYSSKENTLDIYNSILLGNEERLLDLLEQTVAFLNVSKTYPLLMEALNEVVNKLEVNNNDGLTIKFLFHCMSMLERVIKNGAIEYKNFDEVRINKKREFDIVKESFLIIENIFGVTIPNSELAYIVELINIHLDEEKYL